MVDSAIELSGVSKRYRQRRAVQDLELTVAQGEMFGFVGPNGAGKTTTIRLLLGLLRPDSGRVRLLGQEVGAKTGEQDGRARLGFLPDIARIDGGFGGQEWLDYLAALHPVRPDQTYQEQLCDRLELARSDRQRRIKTYSRGMRQKLAIVQALQHRPDLVIMDEPTEGLDPLAKRALFSLLREAQGQGATIFFSSHVLSEVERLCDRVGLIRAGKLVAVDTLATLRDRQNRRIEVAFIGPPPVAELEALAREVGGELRQEGHRWRLNFTGDINPLLQKLARYPVQDLVIEPADLEEIFLSYYRRQE